jgi:hypothetical protein
VIVHNMPQRTPEWHAIRAGKLTGSCAADAIASIKTGEAVSRRDLRMRLIAERLTGQAQEDTYINAAMQRGIDCEPLALAAYESLTGQMVTSVGFVESDDHLSGCSPDGVIGNYDGLLSIKCPKTATQIGYLRSRTMPSSYVPQMLHELWITGAKYYDFLSWDGRLPADLQTFYIRIQRDETAVQEYASKAQTFLLDLDAELAEIQKLRHVA